MSIIFDEIPRKNSVQPEISFLRTKYNESPYREIQKFTDTSFLKSS